MNTYTHTLIIAFFINVNPNVLSRLLNSTSKTIKCYEVVQKKKVDPYGLF